MTSHPPEWGIVTRTPSSSYRRPLAILGLRPINRHGCRNLGTGLTSTVRPLFVSGSGMGSPLDSCVPAFFVPVQECCPHYTAGVNSKPMIAYKDERFVCRDWAHTLRPGVPEYRCKCRGCLRMAATKLDRDMKSIVLTEASTHG